jgi:hypothetical protein
MLAITIQHETIATFKNECPCNGIPANTDIINCVFDKNGDLVDLELVDASDTPISSDKYIDAGAALNALMDDAKNGYATHKTYNERLGVAEFNTY